MKVVCLIKTCLNGTNSKVRLGKYLSDAFPIQNALKLCFVTVTLQYVAWNLQ
jgi:hypothetical protein